MKVVIKNYIYRILTWNSSPFLPVLIFTGFEANYSGEATECDCTDLTPGTNYRVRVLCISLGGLSDWSETAIVTTEAVRPGICQPPHVLGKPKASMLQLKWGV